MQACPSVAGLMVALVAGKVALIAAVALVIIHRSRFFWSGEIAAVLSLRFVFVIAACLLSGIALGATRTEPQDKPLAGRTLTWGADCNGGIPYVIKDPEGRK